MSLYDSKVKMDKYEQFIRIVNMCHDKNLKLNNDYFNDKITKITRLNHSEWTPKYNKVITI